MQLPKDPTGPSSCRERFTDLGPVEKERSGPSHASSRGVDSDFRYYLLCSALRGGKKDRCIETEDEKLCKSSVTGSEHETPIPLFLRKIASPIISPNDCFAKLLFLKQRRLMSRLLFDGS